MRWQDWAERLPRGRTSACTPEVDPEREEPDGPPFERRTERCAVVIIRQRERLAGSFRESRSGDPDEHGRRAAMPDGPAHPLSAFE